MRVQITFDISSAQDLEEARRILNEDLTWTPADAAPTPNAPAPVTPTPAAPTPAAPTPPTPAEVELDSAGRAWNGEYHAASKSKTKDGRWRRKRGVSAEAVDEALPDQRSAPPRAPAPPPSAPPPPPPQPVTPAAAPPPPPPPAPAPAANGTWDAVAAAFAARAGVPEYTVDHLQGVLRANGIEPTTLYAQPELHARAVEVLEAQCPV